MTTTDPDFLRKTRTSYDAVAADYGARFRDELPAKPVELGLLNAFATLVRDADLGPVADLGCGTGRITAYLSGLGVPVFGIDLSPGMLAVARASYPGLLFAEGSMLELDLPDASAGGVLAWYSTIHVPDAQLPRAFAEFHRVLRPGGHALLGFQAGDGRLELSEALGHPVDLVFQRRRPEQVARLLEDAGFELRARLHREREADGTFPERTAQGFVLVRRPGPGAQTEA
jgi:SAM-dependent methyltransferase